MRLTNSFLIILLTCVVFSAWGQDNLSVYFKKGSSRLDKDQMNILNSIPLAYNLSDLDSATFKGYADSSGSYKANLRLSEKRTENVSKYCTDIFPLETVFIFKPVGETNKSIENNDRRVEIILHFKPINSTNDEIIDAPVKFSDACYYRSYGILSSSAIHTITKGKRKFTLIQLAESSSYYLNQQTYYAHEEENGRVVVKKVKWLRQNSGNLWWIKIRYQALIPEEDYSKHSIFYQEGQPCKTCYEDFKKVKKRDTCLFADEFLIDNAQVRPLLGKKMMRLRVPAEYINPRTKHYSYPATPITWKTGRMKRDKHYLYTDLPLNSTYQFPKIFRYFECCDIRDTIPDKNWSSPYITGSSGLKCGFRAHHWKLLFMGGVETGIIFRQNTFTPFFVVGFFKEWRRVHANIISGIDNNIASYSAARIQYNYFSYPVFMRMARRRWKPADQPVKSPKIFMRSYVGTELRNGRDQSKLHYLEQDIHLGLSIVTSGNFLDRNRFLNRIYIQYGQAYDYAGNYSRKLNPVMQFGIVFDIVGVER